jgi:hypothetical protein
MIYRYYVTQQNIYFPQTAVACRRTGTFTADRKFSPNFSIQLKKYQGYYTMGIHYTFKESLVEIIFMQ